MIYAYGCLIDMKCVYARSRSGIFTGPYVRYSTRYDTLIIRSCLAGLTTGELIVFESLRLFNNLFRGVGDHVTFIITFGPAEWISFAVQ